MIKSVEAIAAFRFPIIKRTNKDDLFGMRSPLPHDPCSGTPVKSKVEVSTGKGLK
jgi:hypothetical protein